MKYILSEDFMASLRDLTHKGGQYQKAAEAIYAIVGKINSNDEKPFKGVRTTKRGEGRIKHCVKYDLQKGSRLITVVNSGVTCLYFAGDHDACEKWIEINRGATITLDSEMQLAPVHTSRDLKEQDKRIYSKMDPSYGKLYKKVPERLFEKLTEDAVAEGNRITLVLEFADLESIDTEERILDLSEKIHPPDLGLVFYDFFTKLKAGDFIAAKSCMDLYKHEKIEIDKAAEDLGEDLIDEIEVGNGFLDIERADEELLRHYVETSDFRQWMLYLHHHQREIVEKDFAGPAKISGVSGSGKTCVVIKRAEWLAHKYPGESILVLTLNKALANLISDLCDHSCLVSTRSQIVVKSFWELCREKLEVLEPENRLNYLDEAWKIRDHFDEVWEEYYTYQNNNDDAKIMLPLHKSLLSRKISPKNYIRQEFDYIRSALSPGNRGAYKKMNRLGRVVPLDDRFRKCVTKGLIGWEEKMSDVGVIDFLGLASALYKHMDALRPEYRCILVDEVQDFGAIELQVVRRMVANNENDIFLSGDAAQQVYTKNNLSENTGINIDSRHLKLNQNYRNSREILGAAYSVLSKNLTKEMVESSKIEVIDPEYANFSTPKPLLLESGNLDEEFASSYNYLKRKSDEDPNLKMCIAVCGYGLSQLRKIGDSLNIYLLDGATNIDSGSVFLSDLEQTKGFEFDSMCVVNCNEACIPDPAYPSEESFRELSKLYVAMTRAKKELIISYSGNRSIFFEQSNDFFVEGAWQEHEDENAIPDFVWPGKEFQSDIRSEKNPYLNLTGIEYLHTDHALGMPVELQEKLIELISGRATSLNSKQIQWRSIGAALGSRDVPTLSRLFGPETYKTFRDWFTRSGKNAKR
jgi:hypothetical protein